MSKKLSATMAIALGEAIERGGRLVRHQGGYWTVPGAARSGAGDPFDWWAGTTTVEALVDRGAMKYVEWKEGRGLRFPIVAEVVPARTSSEPPVRIAAKRSESHAAKTTA